MWCAMEAGVLYELGYDTILLILFIGFFLCRNSEARFLAFTILFRGLAHSIRFFYGDVLMVFPYDFIFVFVSLMAIYLEIRYYIDVFYPNHKTNLYLRYSLRIICTLTIILGMVFIDQFVVLENLYYSLIVIYTPFIILALTLLVKLFLRVQLIDQNHDRRSLRYPKIISIGLATNVFISLFFRENDFIREICEIISYGIILYGYIRLHPSYLRRIFTQIAQKERDLLSSENLYRNFVKNSEGIFYQMSMDRNFIFLHGNVTRICGYSPEEFYRGEVTFEKIIFSDDLEKWKEMVYSLFDQQYSSVECEYRISHKNGQVHWVFEHLERFTSSDEEYEYVQGTIFDISDRKQSEIMLQQQKERLSKEELRNEKLQSLALLAGGIAHDFNNILVSISGNIELLQMGGFSETEQEEIYFDLTQATHSAQGLTNQLLTFSKGGTPIKIETDITEILQSTIRFVLAGSSINYEFAFSPYLPKLLVDPGQISQVIHNLVLNAKQAMPNGGSIHISASLESQIPAAKLSIPNIAPSYIKISIQDQGGGIPPSVQENIFTPYFTTKNEGSGLGLATCYSIIHKHQGHITFHSTEGTGTTFIIYLPVAPHLITKPSLPNHSDNEIPPNLHILILDDQAEIHRVLSKFLGVFHCRIQHAFIGEEAVENVKAHLHHDPFDLIIMDLTIPGHMGGEEAMQRIRKVSPSIKSIVSSGYSHNPIMANCHAYGFDQVLKKPYTFRQLESVLQLLFHSPPLPSTTSTTLTTSTNSTTSPDP